MQVPLQDPDRASLLDQAGLSQVLGLEGGEFPGERVEDAEGFLV
jgi:hypothetical protein